KPARRKSSRRTADSRRVTRACTGLWIAAILLSGCASTARQPVAPAVPAAATLPNDLKWTRDAAEYHAAVLQAYRAASDRVAREAASRAPGTWAVSLDADETVISNLQYQI